MTTTEQIKTILVFANKFDAAILEVVRETEKAIEVRNVECGRGCWIPKSAIYLRKPGVETYENEYEVRDWFFAKMNKYQMKALNIME